MQVHPLANIFPLMGGREFDELVNDIKSHGLREPIVRVDGAILDGRNRARACEAAGVQPSFVDFDGADPLRFVISKNLIRRHLTDSQRALVAAQLANRSQGRPRAGADSISRSEACQLLNVSENTVERAAFVRKNACPALLDAVEKGSVSVAAAERISHLSKERQSKIIERGSRAVTAEARKTRRNHAGSGRQQYGALWKCVDAICDALEASDLNKAHGAASELQKEIKRVAASRRQGHAR